MYRTKATTGLVVCTRCGAQIPRAETVFTTDGLLVCARCNQIGEAHAQVERARQSSQAGQIGLMDGGIVGIAVAAAANVAADQKATQDHAQIEAIAGRRVQPLAHPQAANEPQTDFEIYLARRKRMRIVMIVGFAAALVVVPLVALVLGNAGILPRDTIEIVIVLEILLAAGLVRAFFFRISSSI